MGGRDAPAPPGSGLSRLQAIADAPSPSYEGGSFGTYAGASSADVDSGLARLRALAGVDEAPMTALRAAANGVRRAGPSPFDVFIHPVRKSVELYSSVMSDPASALLMRLAMNPKSRPVSKATLALQGLKAVGHLGLSLAEVIWTPPELMFFLTDSMYPDSIRRKKQGGWDS